MSNNIWAVHSSELPKLKSIDPKLFAAAKAEDTGNEVDATEIQVINGNAIVPITGMLVKYPGELCDLVGGTSTLEVQNILRACLENPDIDGITLWIDSPGGQVAGVSDLGKTIANYPKPIKAVISDSCCSGAYWIASQANEVVANESALIGSIGVYEVLVDTSKLYNDAGITFTVVKAGQYKAVGEDGVPITPEDVANEQTVIDDIYGLFVDAVASGRELSPAAVKKLATGEVWIASKAVANGLIDAIGDIEGILSMSENAGSIEANTNNGAVATANTVSGNVPVSDAVAPAVSEDTKVEETKADSKPVDDVNAITSYLKSAQETVANISEPDDATKTAINEAIAECDNLKAALQKVIGDTAEQDAPAEDNAAAVDTKAVELAGYEAGTKDATARFEAVLKAVGGRNELAIEHFRAGHDAGKAREAYVAILESEAKSGGNESVIAVRKSKPTGANAFESDWENDVDGCQATFKNNGKAYIAWRKWKEKASK